MPRLSASTDRPAATSQSIISMSTANSNSQLLASQNHNQSSSQLDDTQSHIIRDQELEEAHNDSQRVEDQKENIIINEVRIEEDIHNEVNDDAPLALGGGNHPPVGLVDGNNHHVALGGGNHPPVPLIDGNNPHGALVGDGHPPVALVGGNGPQDNIQLRMNDDSRIGSQAKVAILGGNVPRRRTINSRHRVRSNGMGMYRPPPVSHLQSPEYGSSQNNGSSRNNYLGLSNLNSFNRNFNPYRVQIEPAGADMIRVFQRNPGTIELGNYMAEVALISGRKNKHINSGYLIPYEFTRSHEAYAGLMYLMIQARDEAIKEFHLQQENLRLGEVEQATLMAFHSGFVSMLDVYNSSIRLIGTIVGAEEIHPHSKAALGIFKQLINIQVLSSSFIGLDKLNGMIPDTVKASIFDYIELKSVLLRNGNVGIQDPANNHINSTGRNGTGPWGNNGNNGGRTGGGTGGRTGRKAKPASEACARGPTCTYYQKRVCWWYLWHRKCGHVIKSSPAPSK